MRTCARANTQMHIMHACVQYTSMPDNCLRSTRAHHACNTDHAKHRWIHDVHNNRRHGRRHYLSFSNRVSLDSRKGTCTPLVPDFASALMHRDSVCKLMKRTDTSKASRSEDVTNEQLECKRQVHLKLMFVISMICSLPMSWSMFHFSEPDETIHIACSMQ